MNLGLATPNEVLASGGAGAQAKTRKLMFMSPLPVNNKTVFVLTAEVTSSIQELKHQLHRQENFETQPDGLDFFLDGVKLDPKRSLSSYQSITHKTVIGIRGAFYEFVVETAAVPNVVSVKWHHHMTVTDMIRSVWKELRGVHLDQCRFKLGEQIIPHQECFQFNYPELDPDKTLCALGFTSTLEEPVTIKFRRSVKGVGMFISLSMVGEATIKQVEEAVLAWETGQRKAAKQDGQDEGWLHSVLSAEGRPKGEAGGTADASMYEPPPGEEGSAWNKDDGSAASEALKGVLEGGMDFDDDTEAISPHGIKRVYLYTAETPSYSPDSSLRPAENYFSFHPVQDEVPTWIDLDSNFKVRHLSDTGVIPGSRVTLEFFSSFYGMWSSEVEFKKEPDAMLTVKTLRGKTTRFPASLNDPVEDVLLRLWCATGVAPQLQRLEDDEGRPLPEWRTLAELGIMQETTLKCVPTTLG